MLIFSFETSRWGWCHTKKKIVETSRWGWCHTKKKIEPRNVNFCKDIIRQEYYSWRRTIRFDWRCQRQDLWQGRTSARATKITFCWQVIRRRKNPFWLSYLERINLTFSFKTSRCGSWHTIQQLEPRNYRSLWKKWWNWIEQAQTLHTRCKHRCEMWKLSL